MKLRKSSLGVAVACAWLLVATGCQTDAPVVSQSPQPESQSESQPVVESTPASEATTAMLLTAETADQPWQVGLTQEEAEGLLAEKAAYEALDEQGKASLREGGGVGCLAFQHLWWEESIATELTKDLTDGVFKEWVKDDQRQKRGACATLYAYAAWRGWSVDDLVEQIEKNGLEEVYPLEQVRVRAAVFPITREQYLAQALKNGLTQEQAKALETMSYRWEEIATMSPDQAVQALNEAKELHHLFNVGELAAQWEDWPRLAAEDKSYVLAAGNGTVNLEELEKAVWDAKVRLDGYSQLKDGINGGGIPLPKTQYANIEYEQHLPGFGPRISLYGQPYQVVAYFRDAKQQAAGVVEASEGRYAISEDGRRILSQCMVDGSWIALEDKDEETITAQ